MLSTKQKKCEKNEKMKNNEKKLNDDNTHPLFGLAWIWIVKKSYGDELKIIG